MRPREILNLQRLIGNRAAQRAVSGVLQRQQPAQATNADRRSFVQSTIDQLKRSVEFFQTATLDQARFDRVIDSWYTMVVRQEEMIDTDLNGDRTLKSDLRAAYTAAIRVLMTQAARQLRRDIADLYRENSGRIPMWAWQIAHHTESGITTPIPEGHSADQFTGDVNLTLNGLRITIARDQFNDGSVRGGAETSFDLQVTSRPRYQWQARGRRRIITQFDPLPDAAATIQTRYAPRSNAASTSAYGRGTTPQDIAGGRVTPHSTSLGFHEGSHGLDYLEFIRNNPAPQFTGTVGMTEIEFLAAAQQLERAWRAYRQRLNAFSLRNTDCVGTTIDQHNQAQARRGTRVVRVCP